MTGITVDVYDSPVDKCALKGCSNTVKRKGKKYCGVECYHKSRNVWEMMSCSHCGVMFLGVPGKSKYHDKACSNSATKSKAMVEKACLRCGITFYVKPSRAETAWFDTYECFNLFRRDGHDGDVEVTCENCGKKRMVPYIHRSKRFCNHSCASSGEFNAFYGVTGPDHPMYGRLAWNKGQTTETDERVMALGRKISEHAKEQFALGIRSNAGELNPNFGYTRADRTPQQLENYSNAAIERLKKGVGYLQGYYTSSKTGDEMFYRSSYELRFMKCLDLDPTVTDYVYEPFPIKLEEGRRYLPDFLVSFVDGRKELVEVKPECFLDDAIVLEKGAAAMKFCIELGIQYRMCSLKDIEQMEGALIAA